MHAASRENEARGTRWRTIEKDSPDPCASTRTGPGQPKACALALEGMGYH